MKDADAILLIKKAVKSNYGIDSEIFEFSPTLTLKKLFEDKVPQDLRVVVGSSKEYALISTKDISSLYTLINILIQKKKMSEAPENLVLALDSDTNKKMWVFMLSSQDQKWIQCLFTRITKFETIGKNYNISYI